MNLKYIFSKILLLLLLLFVFVLTGYSLSAQTTVEGVVKDKETGELLMFANIVVKNTTIGTQSDLDGKFTLTVPSDIQRPFLLECSYLGYTTAEFKITDARSTGLKFQLSPDTGIMIGEVEVKESRVTEKQKESAQTVESLDIIAIKETPAANFYDGLGNLKGVDMTSASLGFKIINTRGFNSTSPVRSLQLIDGVDNQAPGLNFSLGNFLGASELDIQRVDIIAGASSGIYGPNAFNGVISMTTKNPFYHEGLSFMLKAGERALAEGAIRYARVLGKNKRFAFKLNAAGFRANDWESENYAEAYQDVDDPRYVGTDNLGGYNAVNVYGDEDNFIYNSGDFDIRQYPGLGTIYKSGYQEKDLVDYNSWNLKLAPSLHYKLTDNVEFIAGYSFATGTTVYQGDNKYSLKNIRFHQIKAEVKQNDKFFVRAYHTRENDGDSYDAVFTAILLQDAAKPPSLTDNWQNVYQNTYLENATEIINNYPPFQGDVELFNQQVSDLIDQYNNEIADWHQEARDAADNSADLGNQPYFVPGTSEFEEQFNRIVSGTSFNDQGSGFEDRSSLTHLQGQYTFTPTWMNKWIVGANGRIYTPNSNGTIFSDTAGITLTNREFGIYTSLEKRLLEDQLILTATARLDKNENFPFLVSPAASVVYKLNPNHTVRTSFSSAIRNPTLSDQYLYYNVGRAILLGNLDGRDNLVTVDSYLDYFQDTGLDEGLLDYFDIAPIVPEKVRSVELGYKGSIFENSVFIDASWYYSWYRDFIGYQIGIDLVEVEDNDEQIIIPIDKIYRVASNASDQVTTQGFSVGINYFFANYFALNGNYSWNRLNSESDDPIIPAFNTPEHKYNIGISGRDIRLKLGNFTLRNWGFNINYKWVQGFLFEGSPQFTGEVPTYDMLDAQINWKIPKIKTTFKVGASNILNNRSFQTYGGPRVGRLAYISALVELDRKK